MLSILKNARLAKKTLPGTPGRRRAPAAVQAASPTLLSAPAAPTLSAPPETRGAQIQFNSLSGIDRRSNLYTAQLGMALRSIGESGLPPELFTTGRTYAFIYAHPQTINPLEYADTGRTPDLIAVVARDNVGGPHVRQVMDCLLMLFNDSAIPRLVQHDSTRTYHMWAAVVPAADDSGKIDWIEGRHFNDSQSKHPDTRLAFFEKHFTPAIIDVIRKNRGDGEWDILTDTTGRLAVGLTKTRLEEIMKAVHDVCDGRGGRPPADKSHPAPSLRL